MKRFYYGWVVVLTLSVTETISYGILYYAFTVFLTPMQEDLGWSRASLTGALSLALLVSGFAGIPLGRLVDKHGSRLLMSLGSVAATFLVMSLAFVDRLWVFYLTWGLIGLAMAAVLYEPAFATLARWFVRKRGRALTVLTFIAGFASVIFIPLAAFLVEGRGWRQAFLILGAILAFTIPLHALLLRRKPQDIGLLPDGETLAVGETPRVLEPSLSVRDALKSMNFWWLTFAFSFNTLASVALMVQLLPYLLERGYAPALAAGAAGAVGVMALPGRLIFTPLGSVWPRHYVTATLFGLQVLALVVLMTVPGSLGVWLFVLTFGAGFGAVTPARAALVAETYGAENYGSINGVMMLVNSLARALAPVGSGILFTLKGNYTLLLYILLGVSLLSVFTVLLARGENSSTLQPASLR